MKPTLQTTTQNGVTITNNGDGTYTLNGTASPSFVLGLGNDSKAKVGQQYKFLGCPIAPSTKTIQLGWNNHGYATIEGLISTKTKEIRNIDINVADGYKCDNLVIKPMLTTNFNATYDDFVPYTGDTGHINSDLAALLKRVEALENK